MALTRCRPCGIQYFWRKVAKVSELLRVMFDGGPRPPAALSNGCLAIVGPSAVRPVAAQNGVGCHRHAEDLGRPGRGGVAAACCGSAVGVPSPAVGSQRRTPGVEQGRASGLVLSLSLLASVDILS